MKTQRRFAPIGGLFKPDSVACLPGMRNSTKIPKYLNDIRYLAAAIPGEIEVTRWPIYGTSPDRIERCSLENKTVAM
jgi:hypothetical protein